MARIHVCAVLQTAVSIKHGAATITRVSFSFLPNGGREGGGKIRLYRLLGGKYVSVCKVCGKLGGSRGMLPWKILPFIGRNLVESGTVFAQT